jgi:hypothetical protein
MTPEQQQRQAEVDAYNTQLYEAQGWRAVATTVTQDGQRIDWLDVTGADFPGDPPASPPDEIALPGGAERQLTELDEHPELVGPWGTIPIYRNRFARYVRGESGASSLEDFLDNHQEMGRSDGANRLYAGLVSNTPNTGAVGWMNQFAGDVEDGTFSLIELAVFCAGTDKANTLEQIGIVASRDKANFGDALLRLHVEFFTAGPKKIGANQGGWDERQIGFRPLARRRYAPGMLLRASTVGGPQEQARFEIRLFNDKWYVGYNEEWIGSYDASLFPEMSRKGGACGAAWYGEVFDPTPGTWTTTGMGSGQFASSGYGNAAWVSSPVLYADLSGFWSTPPVDLTMVPDDPACYTRTALAKGSNGLPLFFLGGPGGQAPGCK